MKRVWKSLLMMSVAFIVPTVLLADSITMEDVVSSIDTMWTLLAAFLVFFMQAGFALVEAGFTRSKNTVNIIMKNFTDFLVGSILYWLVGFTIMFGVGNGFIGWQGSFEYLGLNIPLNAFLIFQTVFAATAATIVSGAMAERTKFTGYLIYSVFISAFIYPIVGHWIWGGGWLSDMVDFAGSTVVHSVGGWAALMGTMVLGPRTGKYRSDGTPNKIPGHSLVLAALGVFILWFGWFGFNPGSTISGLNLKIADIAMTTNLAAASGGLGALTIGWFIYKKPDVNSTLNGVLAGLVGITAGTASVTNVGAAIIGALSGGLVVLAIDFFDKIHIDDPVGAISVHGVGGAFGTLMVGIFAVDGGLLYGGGLNLFLTQLKGVLAVAGWTVVTTYILFKSIDLTIGLRIDSTSEIEGLDFAEHGSVSYPDLTPLKGRSVRVKIDEEGE
ncbi:ammonium transporter [Petrotoga mobilis SJ95]|uniref:Ammonium transporter n=1 Tax=Petrotoga mobilis (strain DSM 10674 / SJ95) TaxID=403833 RepID=A9BIZ7_PETMO|nr:ammonium transporter [Petrotoga mobilis]ABX32485.1 ammonium transporter [Petrotoga mobilis SJ95]